MSINDHQECISREETEGSVLVICFCKERKEEKTGETKGRDRDGDLDLEELRVREKIAAAAQTSGYLARQMFTREYGVVKHMFFRILGSEATPSPRS